MVSKIDSNATGLRFAEEDSIGVLPASPVWLALEPNEYEDFGAKIKTLARNPINSSRQRKKGVVVDLDAAGGFQMDITQDNAYLLMQGFLFADARTHAEITDVADVDGTGNDYQPTAGGGDYFANNLLFAKNFSNSANNGLKLVTGTPSASSVAVTDTGLQDENGAEGTISRVGHQFGTGVASINAAGTLPTLEVSGNVQASQVLTTTANFANNETVTIGSVTYTFKTVITTAANDVDLGADAEASLENLRNAINRNGVGTPGTDFSAATEANPHVTAVNDATTLTVTSIKSGTLYNSVATTEVCANASWGAATLAGGTGRSLQDYGLVIGFWVCIGDDATANKFATAANNGLKRIKEIEDSAITFDKSTSTMVTDAGAGKDIRVFWGRVVRNEAAELQVRRSFQFERSLGAPDENNPADIQAEYLLGSIANEFEMEIKQGDKLMANLSFMSSEHETRTAAEGRKDGERPTLIEADAFNATSHVKRLSLAVVDAADEAPDDLFAYITDLTLSINNNVKPNKAIKVLGAFDNTAGTFEVDADCTAYFATVEALQTVRDNADVTLDVTFAQANKGITFDMPLLSVGDALADVKQDEPIMLPITQAAASGSKLDADLDYTLLVQFWDYLPDLAA
jgi:hypothetical protein